MHVPMSVVECLLRVYHYHTSIYRLEGKLRVRSFISLLEKNGGFQKMTWEFLWKTFFDFMTSIGRSGVASKRFLYEWHMRNNSNWFLGRRSFVPQTPFFCNDCYRTIMLRLDKAICSKKEGENFRGSGFRYSDIWPFFYRYPDISTFF